MDIFSYLLGKNSTSGGGGNSGLEYEEGTIVLNEDAQMLTVSYSNEHTKAPICISVCDVTGEQQTTNYSNISFTFFDVYKAFGNVMPGNEGGFYPDRYAYGYCSSIYRNTSGASFSLYCRYHTYSSDEDYDESSETSTKERYPKYWATNTSFKAYCPTGSQYWRKNRTYKWIAIFMD